jgi:hypothetical protein
LLKGRIRQQCPHLCGKAFLPNEVLYGCQICDEASPPSGSSSKYKFTLEDPKNPVCPKCGRFVFEIFCPQCQESHPPGLRGVSQTHIIAIAGYTNSGKTCYVTSLIETLRKKTNLSAPTSIAFAFADDKSDEMHRRRLIQLHDEGLIENTKLGIPDPLIISLALDKRRETVSLVFYDVAGETFRERSLIEKNAWYIANAAGIILLVPSNQVEEETSKEKSGRRNLERISYKSPDAILENIQRHIRDHGRFEEDEKVGTPLAITLTKIDKLPESIKESQLFQPPRPRAITDAEELLAIRERCENLLKDPLFKLGNLVDLAKARFQSVSYFGVQSVTETSNGLELSPIRVEQPFLWILQELGLLRPRNFLVRSLRVGEDLAYWAANFVRR